MSQIDWRSRQQSEFKVSALLHHILYHFCNGCQGFCYYIELYRSLVITNLCLEVRVNRDIQCEKSKTTKFHFQIDHFGFDNGKAFQQRYLVANQFWNNDGGPIFFYTGNEGDITWFCNNTVRI